MRASLLLSALLLPPCPGGAFSPPLASRAPATLRPAQLAAIPLRMEEDKKVQIAKDDKAPAEEEDSLYSSFDFEFDATTVTALLGAAIAFQFFVLGNL